ncbi:MAG: SGNH/GDSL hydrolase family protein [Selenomonadaceae bacterium]|nr:SGNH/GDSL hydrolase family protein [Selenomonadaceae bacterium]
MDIFALITSLLTTISSVIMPSAEAVENQIEVSKIEMAVENSVDESDEEIPEESVETKKFRLVWNVFPSAVKYQVVIVSSLDDYPEDEIVTRDEIYTNGVEIDLSQFESPENFYWKVCPLTYEGLPLADFSDLRPLSDADINPTEPRITTQFGQMAYSPLFPVYSWIPVAIPTDEDPFGENAMRHEVEVLKFDEKTNSFQFVRSLIGEQYDVYDESPYNVGGTYFWHVRSISEEGYALSEWSDFSTFEVTAPTKVAAFGDSITHGGGAMSVPPGYLIYDWETYCDVPVKNLGHSGDTTKTLLDRFERDVLPFAPKILIIMGGVNDFREGIISSWRSTQNLKAISKKCEEHGIIPIFLTATPINPAMMEHFGFVETPPADWQKHQKYINDWIMKQPYHIDVASQLADADGNLYDTSDGLHPNQGGKQIIGEMVNTYLKEHFADELE